VILAGSGLSWQAIGALGYDVDTFPFSLGYRALLVDEHSGSGSGEKDANLHGAILALNVQW
jgi:hypothetical protein